MDQTSVDRVSTALRKEQKTQKTKRKKHKKQKGKNTKTKKRPGARGLNLASFFALLVFLPCSACIAHLT
jgi:hypothetical protein